MESDKLNKKILMKSDKLKKVEKKNIFEILETNYQLNSIARIFRWDFRLNRNSLEI